MKVKAEAISGWVHGEKALTISDRFCLLAVMITSNNPDEISKAYGLLTRQNGKSTVSKMIDRLVQNRDYFDERAVIKLERRKNKYKDKAKEYYIEHRDACLNSRKKYYEAHKIEILRKQRERRRLERESRKAARVS